jgi:DoxX-like family
MSISKGALWGGRVASALPTLALIMSGGMKLTHAPQIVEQFTGKFGFQEGSLTPIGILELACLALYLVPRTAVLGAILLTGYLGGAVVTHVRVGDPFFAPVILGILVWVGLYLRDERLHALVPLRNPAP